MCFHTKSAAILKKKINKNELTFQRIELNQALCQHLFAAAFETAVKIRDSNVRLRVPSQPLAASKIKPGFVMVAPPSSNVECPMKILEISPSQTPVRASGSSYLKQMSKHKVNDGPHFRH